jgi:hypothetical protein
MNISKKSVRQYIIQALNAYVSPDVKINNPNTDKLTFLKAGLKGGRVNAYRIWYINQNLLQPNNAGDVTADELTEKTKISTLIDIVCKLLKQAGHSIT